MLSRSIDKLRMTCVSYFHGNPDPVPQTDAGEAAVPPAPQAAIIIRHPSQDAESCTPGKNQRHAQPQMHGLSTPSTGK